MGKRFVIGVVLFASLAVMPSVFGWELEVPEASPGTWGYRPAPGSVAETNPPAFTWGPEREAARYRLEIGRGAAFDEIVYTSPETRWSAHCPSRALAPGRYSWRYSGVNEAGERSNWSETRQFQVAADAAVFSQPTLSELIQRMPAGHPRLFFRPEDVPRLRDLARGAQAERLAKLVEEAEHLIESPPDVSEPARYPEGTEYKGKEWKEIWWGNRVRSIAVADGAALLGFVYQLTGEARYGRAGCDLLLALCAWDAKGSTAYEYNDEAAMPLLYMPSRAYSWMHELLSPEERTRVCEMMQERGSQAFNHLIKRQHLWTPFESHRNRAWHFLGEVAVAFQGEIPDAEQWLDYAMTIFFTTYPVWGGADGGWHEGVGYWASYIERFLYWVHVVRAAFGIDAFEKPYFREAGYYPLYVTPPGTTTAGFADMGPKTGSSRSGPLMAMLAASGRNPTWQWYAERHAAALPGGYLGFIYETAVTAVEARAPEDLPASRVFRDVGLAVLNTTLVDTENNVQIQLKSDPFGRVSHGHNSNNAFLLHWRGLPVFVSTGWREIHGSKHHTKWMWETKSDNAILVNGAGQKVHTPEATGAIAAFRTTPRVDIAVGEAAASYKELKRWTRRIVFIKPDVVVIHDVLEAEEPATFQWLLHAPGAFEIGEQEAVWCGEPGMARVSFLTPDGLALSQTDAFDPPPAEWSGIQLEQWHLTAAAGAKAKRQDFLVVIRLGEHAPNPVVKRAGKRHLLRFGEGKNEVALELGWKHFKVRADGGEIGLE